LGESAACVVMSPIAFLSATLPCLRLDEAAFQRNSMAGPLTLQLKIK
jgi:hypothetical protein